MANWGKITRRTFLVGSVAVAGGVGFGVWKIRQPVANPLNPPDGVALNPFLILDRSGVTLVLGRGEMGQGVHTTLAAMLAEELDLDWEAVKVVHGPASAAYWNGELAGAAAPGHDYARQGWQLALADGIGAASKLMGFQITGGSTSARDGYAQLRHAGASAREALKAAAAARLGVAVERLTTEAGAVVAPDGTRLAYAELAEDAARIAPPQVEPRRPADWKLLGRSLPRPDSWPKVTGAATYGVDVRLPGMKFASPRQLPVLAEALVRADTAPALAVPGVERVLELGTAFVVIARNSWAAMEGAKAIGIEARPVAGLETTEAIFARIASALDGARNSRGRNDGDVDRALAGAARVVEAEYRLPFLAHTTMEPMNATALFTEERLELWCGNQTPRVQAQKAGAAVGLREDQVVVHTLPMGGGFGRRLESDFSVLAARAAQAMPGTPVQVVWSREEDTTHDFYRPGVVARLRGAVEGGRALAFEARIAAPSVMRQAGGRMLGMAPGGPDSAMLEGAADQPYAIPNYRVEGYLADLPIPLGFWRSVGASHNGFIHEGFIDELAHAAGRDPLAFRLELMRPESEVAANVLETVGRLSGWDRPKAPGTGRGVAFTWSFGTPVAQVIEVADQGGGIRLSRAWIVADLGRALDPGIVQQQMESGLIYGLSAAIHGRITFEGGAVQEQNFPDYDALRISGVPRIETFVHQVHSRMGGAGEPATPPAAAALTNAIFDLNGVRARELPLGRQFNFVL
jgi:isoquinoline 1-oxidoreductase beta subunit